MKLIAMCIAAFIMAGCHTLRSDYDRATDLQAELPRAQGLGAFSGSCIFFCFVHAEFTQGNTTPVEVLDKEGHVKSHNDVSIRLKTEQPPTLKRISKPKGATP